MGFLIDSLRRAGREVEEIGWNDALYRLNEKSGKTYYIEGIDKPVKFVENQRAANFPIFCLEVGPENVDNLDMKRVVTGEDKLSQQMMEKLKEKINKLEFKLRQGSGNITGVVNLAIRNVSFYANVSEMVLNCNIAMFVLPEK